MTSPEMEIQQRHRRPADTGYGPCNVAISGGLETGARPVMRERALEAQTTGAEVDERAVALIENGGVG
jgi:hypothetical protein